MVEVPVHWLWLARGNEPKMLLQEGANALVVRADPWTRWVDSANVRELKVPLFVLSVRVGSNSKLDDLVEAEVTRIAERAVTDGLDGKLFGVVKSKGVHGGVSSGATGTVLVDSVEMGLVYATGAVTTPGLVPLTDVRTLKLTKWVKVDVQPKSDEVARVPRYERGWVI